MSVDLDISVAEKIVIIYGVLYGNKIFPSYKISSFKVG